MRVFLVVVFIFVIGSGFSYWYASSAHICPIPIKYRVGEIDQRFQFSKEQAIAVLATAEKIWEEPSQQNLFVYDEESDFTVNFIYDERQRLASTEEEWRLDLDQQERESQRLVADIEDLRKEYSYLEEKYIDQRDSYEDKLERYNRKVEKYNNQGGAPSDVFEDLKEEKEELAELLQALLRVEKELNQSVDNINNLGEKSNEKIKQYNENVLRYNEVFGSSDTFTQGDFKRERINIYKFSNTTELTRVLAHEFGHSLGISHVEDESSVMYHLAKEQSVIITLSTEDKEALADICGEKILLSVKVRKFIRDLLAYF